MVFPAKRAVLRILEAVVSIGIARARARNDAGAATSTRVPGPSAGDRSPRGPLRAHGARWVAVALATALLGGPDASTVRAAAYVWNAPLNDPVKPQGGVGRWSNPKDWLPQAVPTATDNVTIPAGAGALLLDVNATVQNFTQSGPASFLQGNPNKVGPGFDLTVKGMFTWSGGTEANARGARNGSTIAQGGFAISGGVDLRGAPWTSTRPGP